MNKEDHDKTRKALLTASWHLECIDCDMNNYRLEIMEFMYKYKPLLDRLQIEQDALEEKERAERFKNGTDTLSDRTLEKLNKEKKEKQQ